MSRLKFSYPRNLVVPDNLRFTHVDGHVSMACDVPTWYDKITKHEKDNGRELAPDWKEAAQDQLCRILPPGWCTYDTGEAPNAYVNVRMVRADFLNGMATLTRIVASPNPLVDQAEAARRAAICAACQANVGIEGCSACMGIANAVADIKGSGVTEADPLLRVCAVCRCSNKAQVWIKTELLVKGVTDEQRQEFATIEHCWKREALQIPFHQP